MSLRKIFAVGCVVVLGTVGMAVAQLPDIVIDIDDNVLIGARAQTGQVELSYTVLSTATMAVTAGTNLANDQLLLPLLNTGVAPMGGAATVNVQTNFSNWDVLLTLENGGFLATTDPETWERRYLRTTGGTSALCTLDIVIALRPAGPVGASGPARSVAVVGKHGADSLIADGTYGTPYTISFAELLGTKGWTGNVDGRNAAAVLNNGFAGGTEASSANGITFTVSAGLGAAATSPVAATRPTGNPDGVYTETLRFNMLASY